MDRRTLDYLMHKTDSRRDRRDMRDYEDGRSSRRDYRDYEDSRRGRRDGRDGRDYRDHGNVDFEGTMDFADGRDYHRVPRLSKTDMRQWKHMMENEDGTHGPHYDMQQVMHAADKIGIDFDKDEFDEKEFCMAINMMYSDYCKVAKKYISPDRELMFFAELAKAFLCDEDGPGASEKLALYYNCIVDA